MASPPPGIRISRRLSFSGQLCTVRYNGPVAGTTGIWLGVEWDNPTLGKHAGRHNEITYFTCRSASPTAASFVRHTRPHDQPKSFLEALRDKYVAEASPFVPALKRQIFFNGKLAEEIGFEKVAAQQALLGELRVVILDGLLVAGMTAGEDDALLDGFAWNRLVDEVGKTCGNISELDLSRNPIGSWKSVLGICQGLPKLRKLVLDGNRLAGLDTESPSIPTTFNKIKELSVAGMLHTWEEITTMLKLFPSMEILSLASNNLSQPFSTLPTEYLTSLNLSFNIIGSFDSIIPFSTLPNLTTLILKSCSITSLTNLPNQFLVLTHLDISSNNIPSLNNLSTLPQSFPALTSLRCSSNPFYTALPVEEAHMLTAARIPSLTMLNYSRISLQEREDAELYYLSRIRAEISNHSLVTNDNSTLIHDHPLIHTLAHRHAQTEDFATVIAEAAAAAQENHQTAPLNPSSLEARLIELKCTTPNSPHEISSNATRGGETFTLIIPKTASTYRLKSIVGRSIHRSPRLLKLIWETGEIDPVARNLGNPGRVGEGRRIAEVESEDESESNDADRHAVKWVRREVELVDSTRPLGYWIEGRVALIRVELVQDI